MMNIATAVFYKPKYITNKLIIVPVEHLTVNKINSNYKSYLIHSDKNFVIKTLLTFKRL